MPKSSLHTLSHPIESSANLVTEKTEKDKKIAEEVKKEKSIKFNFVDYIPMKELRILFGFIGFIVVVGAVILVFQSEIRGWYKNGLPGLVNDFSAQQDDGANNSTIPPLQYSKFEGANYSFYFPQKYGYLVRNQGYVEGTIYPLEVYFNDVNGNQKFWLKEYIWKGPLDLSIGEAMNFIYGNRSHRVGQNREFYVGERLFLKREYSEMVCDESNVCNPIQISVGYGVDTQGSYVFIFNNSVETEEFENNVMQTFNLDLVDKSELSLSLFKEKLTSEMKMFEVIRTFGEPELEYAENRTIMTYRLPDLSLVKFEFRDQSITKATFTSETENYEYDLLGDIEASFKVAQTLSFIRGSEDVKGYQGGKVLYYSIITDSFNPNLWVVKISEKDESKKLTEWKILNVDKETGELVIKSPDQSSNPQP